jgi:hypothetical protein
MSKVHCIKGSILVLAFGGAAYACAQEPAKAPNSDPPDMTTAGHEGAAQKEQSEAAEHRQMQQNVAAGKPSVEAAQKQEHGNLADKHDDFARQHREAAGARDAGR